MQKNGSANRVIVIDDDVTDVTFLQRAVTKFDKDIELVHICETDGIEKKT